MFHSDTDHIKLIDFGFAAQFKNNEIKKSLSIAGTISFGCQKFLEFCSKSPFDSLLNQEYEYERTFDLYCALNVIMIMTDNSLKDQFYAIKHQQSATTHQKTILAMHKFWLDLEMKSKYYSNLLKLCNNLNFESLVNNIMSLLAQSK
jgi:hypothetical protein